ncbi:YsnF/AvaK domain-containing protein [Mucilaginibacter sp.]|uniref:YsnF/AvaK domain-containing protein n=1 Tax=Mucilaginibacter sp. TaxID=1882438 RepID=UPI003B0069BF
MNEFEKLPIVPIAGQEEISAKKIVLMEERLKIDLKKVETGSVQIHKSVISEEVTHHIPVISEQVLIEHKPINQYVTTVPEARVEGDTTIISVVKEVLVVEKRLMLVEEIHLTKTKTETITAINETLRKYEVEINRIDSEQTQQSTIIN